MASVISFIVFHVNRSRYRLLISSFRLLSCMGCFFFLFNNGNWNVLSIWKSRKSRNIEALCSSAAQLCLDLEIQMVMIIVIKSISRRTMQTNVAISSSIAILSFCCDFRMKPRHMWLGKPLFFGTKWDCHMKYLWIFLEKNKYSAHNSYVYEIGCSKSSEKIYSPHRNLNRIDEFWFRLFFFRG